MATIVFIVAAIFMRNKIGALIALSIAIIADFFSGAAYVLLANFQPVYVYYVAMFLIVFGWWMAVWKLEMVFSQILAGMATAFMTVAVMDCYFSGGYETALSTLFPYAVALINGFTILAAWYDRDMFNLAGVASRDSSDDKYSKANH